MGLRKTFESLDYLAYRIWPPYDPLAPGPLKEQPCPGIFPDTRFNTDFIHGARIYDQELYVFDEPWFSVVWAESLENALGPVTLHFLSLTKQVCIYSWNVNVWSMDGYKGILLYVENDDTAVSNDPSDPLSKYKEPSLRLNPPIIPDLTFLTSCAMAGGPQGQIFATASHPFYTGPADGIRTYNPTTTGGIGEVAQLPSGVRMTYGHFGKAGALDYAAHANLDPANDLAFLKWANEQPVSVYRASTGELLHQLWAPNEITGIILNDDGYVYLSDRSQFITCYTYDGKYAGQVNQPAPLNGVPVVWGWDRVFHRLLRVPITPNGPAGMSTLVMEGYYPVPEPTQLVGPLPRKVARKGRRVSMFAHLAGDGGEAIAGFQGKFTGDVIAQSVSDLRGDLVVPYTAGEPGAQNTTVTVET